MGSSIAITGLACLACLAIYQFIIRPAFISPLSKVPNAHWSSPFTTFWSDKKYRLTNGERLFHRFHAAHQRNGPLIRLGRDEVSVNSLEGLRSVYTAALDKDPLYEIEFAVQSGHPPMIAMPDRATHTARKRLVASVYSKSFLMNSPDLHTLAERTMREGLLPQLKAAASSAAPVNVLMLFQYAGADLLAGYQLGTAHSTKFLTKEDPHSAYFGPEITGTWLDNREGGAAFILSKTTAALSALDTAQSAPDETQPVILAKLAHGLRNAKPPCPEAELPKACTSELLDNLVAGHEGVGITVTYALWQLSRRPSLQARLRSELARLDPGVPASGMAPLDALPLLDAVLTETLRLYAAAPGPEPRIVGRAGLELHGAFLPSGTTISSNPYCLHRNEKVFPEPLEWRPERWLDEGGQAVDGEARKWLWAFSSGARGCIGSHFATLALKLQLATVYANFTTEVVDDEGIEQAESIIAGPVGNKLFLQFHHVDESG